MRSESLGANPKCSGKGTIFSISAAGTKTAILTPSPGGGGSFQA